MKFIAKVTDVTKVEADVLALFAKLGKTDEDVILSDEIKRIDKLLGGILSEIINEEKYQVGLGKTLLLHTHGVIPAKRILIVGIGKASELLMKDWLTVGAVVGRKAKGVKAKRVAVSLPNEVHDLFGSKQGTQGFVEGMTLGTYTFHKHKNADVAKKDEPIDEVSLLTPAAKLNAVDTGIREGVLTGSAVVFARDLVNEPSSVTTPVYLAQVARELTRGKSQLSVEILGKEEMKKLGMGGLLGIAQGSDQEPRFIILRYQGNSGKTIALAGKGITFDTGGLSLKPSEHMEAMKLDMAGAAAILGVFSVITELRPTVNVVGLISATENMPSGRAIKPGDVVSAMNGKTIEILNTDAEGRVVLADALSYAAEKVHPDIMIDVATLTGACVTALGEEIAGFFANDATLGAQVKEAAKRVGESIWELPLAKEYKEFLKSTVADVKNISGKRNGGAINGALFLEEFVPPGTPWVHLDIAGPAFAEKDAPLTPHGGTGFGVLTMLGYVSTFS